MNTTGIQNNRSLEHKEEELNKVRDKAYTEFVNLLKEFGKAHLSCLTGFGKTVMFKRFVREHFSFKILFITETVDQAKQMQDYMTQYNKKNKAITYQSLALKRNLSKNIDMVSKFNVILFDETQNMGANNCDIILDTIAGSGILIGGGTATELRTDGINVAAKFFDNKTVKYTMTEAREQGFILDPLVLSTVYLGIRVQDVRAMIDSRINNKWAVSQLNGMERAISERNTIDLSIKKAIETSGEGIWIVYHPNLKAIDRMKSVFDNAFVGAQSFVVSSNKEHFNVAQFIERHQKHSVVHSVNMLNTGWHFEDIAGVVLNRMTDSPIMDIQQIGRVVELLGIKRKSIVDVVGRFSSTRQRFREETASTGVYRGSEFFGRSEESYTIDDKEQLVQFEKILDAIELWANPTRQLLTEEQVLYTIRKFGHKLGDASRASGIPEVVLAQMLAEKE